MFDPKTKILVVDDMMTMRKVIMKNLKSLEFSDMSEAPDGTKAWEMIMEAQPPYGLIISDWNMPNCTGIDLLKRVRGDARFKKTPFLLVTAEAEQSQVLEAVKAGVDQYVIKPFNAEQLKGKLEMVHKKYKT